MRVNITPKFFLKNVFNREGKQVLHCRLIVNRKKSEFSTGLYTNPKHWNEEFKRSTNDIEVNNKLSEIETKLQEIADKLYFDNTSISSKKIVDMYKGKNLGNFTISEYFEYYLYETGRIKVLAKGYFAKFVTLNGLLKKFTKKYYKTTAFDMRSIDFKFISEFDTFLKGQISKQFKRPYSPAYIQKSHSTFRTVLISAHKQGIIKFQPYQDFPIRKVKTEIKYLSVNELERLKNLDLRHNLSLDKVKDIFLFSVYTGLRFKDAQNATVYDIEYENDEPKYIIKYQEKTNDKVEIPLLKPTLNIIEKYKNSIERMETGCLIPKLSNPKLNAYLKTIGDLAHIRLNLTHHVARHTCATTVLIENEVPLNEVSKWLGHADIKSTKVYAHVTREKLRSTADRINEALIKE